MNKIKWIRYSLFGLAVIFTVFFIVSFFVWNEIIIRVFLVFVFGCLIGAIVWIHYALKTLRKEAFYQMSPIKNFDFDIYSKTYIWEIDQNGLITYMSDSIVNTLGYAPKDLIDKYYIWELNKDAERLKIMSELMDCIFMGKSLVGYENIVINKNGDNTYVVSSTIPITNNKGEIIGLQGWDTDITHEKNIESALRDNEAMLRSLFENMNEAFVIYEILYDAKGDPYNYKIVDHNKNFYSFIGTTGNPSLKGRLITDVFKINTPPFFDKFVNVERNKTSLTFNRYISVLKKYFRISLFSPSTSKVAAMYADVTEDKKLNEVIENLSYVDKQTTLNNRRYFEESIPFFTTDDKLPLAIILADLNALKLTNDVYGHEVGDALIKASADILKSFAKNDALLARIGGDEFVMLCPSTTYDEGLTLLKNIAQTAKETKCHDISLSLSLGFEVLNKDPHHSTFTTTLKRAESKLYTYKLKYSFKAKETIFKQIETLLYDAYPHEKTHAQNVMDLTMKLANYLKIDASKKILLKEAAYYHDIGKIHLSNATLTGEPLTESEALKMKRHPEIGYRITSSIFEKAAYSVYLLSHHENFDGSGYPRRIKGEEIPLFSRMIRIVEAYDRMINGYYKDKLSFEAAVKELLENKGTLFDPKLVDAFIEVIS